MQLLISGPRMYSLANSFSFFQVSVNHSKGFQTRLNCLTLPDSRYCACPSITLITEDCDCLFNQEGSGVHMVAYQNHPRNFLNFKNTPQFLAAKIESDWQQKGQEMREPERYRFKSCLYCFHLFNNCLWTIVCQAWYEGCRQGIRWRACASWHALVRAFHHSVVPSPSVIHSVHPHDFCQFLTVSFNILKVLTLCL